jgi:hypothetical protein
MKQQRIFVQLLSPAALKPAIFSQAGSNLLLLFRAFFKQRAFFAQALM